MLRYCLTLFLTLFVALSASAQSYPNRLPHPANALWTVWYGAHQPLAPGLSMATAPLVLVVPHQRQLHAQLQ